MINFAQIANTMKYLKLFINVGICSVRSVFKTDFIVQIVKYKLIKL